MPLTAATLHGWPKLKQDGDLDHRCRNLTKCAHLLLIGAFSANLHATLPSHGILLCVVMYGVPALML